MKYKIPFINPCYRRFYKANPEALKAVNRCLSEGELTLRKDVWDLEKNIAKFVGTKYAAGVGSGTDALFLSLLALGIGPGDEVISCSNTFIATIQAIVHTGATPILIDVGEDEQMNIDQIEGVITKKTKAIIPVHYTGAMPDMERIMQIAKKHKLHVVEDACQALGATQSGKKAGSFGILGCFSFNTAKLLGGLCDGGMVVTDDRKLYEKICLLRNHWNVHQLSVDRNDYPQPKEMQWAWKSRLSNVNASFISVKFKKLPWMIKRREEIARAYNEAFSRIADIERNDLQILKGYLEEKGFRGGRDVSEIKDEELCELGLKMPHESNGRIWQEFHLRVKNRDAFAKHMQKKGIETLTRDVVPNHKMKGLNLEHFNLPITEKLACEVIRLPLHEHMTDAEVGFVIRAVKSFFKK